jgi:1,4-dihydroxy-2-naphthoate octaprenyltransferase
VGTNFANDYYDFFKGADTEERVGPRRAVASGLIAPAVMRRAMIGVFAAAFLVGLTLLGQGGWPLLIIGVASILCGVAYTGGPYPLAYHGWGDVFVFIFFGLVAVGATCFVQMGRLPLEAWLAGAGIGALATNILVANNYRDVETDAKAGKRTLLVRWGRGYGRVQFAAAHLIAAAVPAGLAGLGALSVVAGLGLGLASLVMGFMQVREQARAVTPQAWITLLGHTGRWLAIYGLALAGCLLGTS